MGRTEGKPLGQRRRRHDDEDGPGIRNTSECMFLFLNLRVQFFNAQRFYVLDFAQFVCWNAIRSHPPSTVTGDSIVRC